MVNYAERASHTRPSAGLTLAPGSLLVSPAESLQSAGDRLYRLGRHIRRVAVQSLTPRDSTSGRKKPWNRARQPSRGLFANPSRNTIPRSNLASARRVSRKVVLSTDIARGIDIFHKPACVRDKLHGHEESAGVKTRSIVPARAAGPNHVRFWLDPAGG